MKANASAGAPDVGAVIRRLRTQRGISVRALAAAAGLSPSFLGAVERGDSDVALGRLNLIARALDHDVASLLNDPIRQAAPRFIAPARQGARGDGVSFSAFRVPGSQLGLLVACFEPHSGLDDSITLAGIGIAYLAQGELVLVVDAVEHRLHEGQCIVWPSSQPDALRNDSETTALVIAFATGIAH